MQCVNAWVPERTREKGEVSVVVVSNVRENWSESEAGR
jgi:hypothetical protein